MKATRKCDRLEEDLTEVQRQSKKDVDRAAEKVRDLESEHEK